MKTTDFLGFDRHVWVLLGSLWGLCAGCGADAKSPQATSPDSRPASASDDDESDSAMTPTEGSDPASTPSKSTLDAGRTATARSDAGGPATAHADAASARADAAATEAAATPSDAATMQLDAAPTHAAVDAGTDAASAPVQSHDAAADAASGHVLKVDSKDVWTASGFQVEAGRCYTIAAKIDDRWLDLDVPADLSGWQDKSDLRLALFEPFRRVAQDDIGFYQFATCVDKKLDQCFPVGAMSSVCPKVSGELYFFVNDVSGFENNNVGTATVTIQAK